MNELLPAPTGVFKEKFGSDNRTEWLPNAVPTYEAALPSDLVEDVADAARHARSESTKRGYRVAWRKFSQWCADHGRCALPAAPETVQAWIAALGREQKVSTITHKLAAIANAHRLNAYPFDHKLMTGFVLEGLRRKNGTAAKKAKAINLDAIREALGSLPSGISGTRDRALLLVGFFGALRRSEIVGIDVAHVEIMPQGIRLTIPRSKTDQYGTGQVIGLPRRGDDLCPVRAFEEWMAISGIREGAVFRRVLKGGAIADRLTAQSVRLIIQKRTGRDDFTAHGLRSGFVTEAARRGVASAVIRKTTRHTNDR